jgi:hypothetical protein
MRLRDIHGADFDVAPEDFKKISDGSRVETRRKI